MRIIRGDFLISDEQELLDLDIIFHFLTNSYWAKGRTRQETIKSCQNSLCFGLYKSENMIGFARIVTDYTTFAYLMDVFILPEFRGQGLSLWLLKVIFDQPALKNIQNWMLATKDAHKLYQKFAFQTLENCHKYMLRKK